MLKKLPSLIYHLEMVFLFDFLLFLVTCLLLYLHSKIVQMSRIRALRHTFGNKGVVNVELKIFTLVFSMVMSNLQHLKIGQQKCYKT